MNYFYFVSNRSAYQTGIAPVEFSSYVLCPSLHLIPNTYIRIISIIYNLAYIWLMNFLALWLVCVYMCVWERECVSVCIIHRGSLKEKNNLYQVNLHSYEVEIGFKGLSSGLDKYLHYSIHSRFVFLPNICFSLWHKKDWETN